MHACELTRSIRRYTAPRPLLLPLESRTCDDTMPPAACRGGPFGNEGRCILLRLRLAVGSGFVAHEKAEVRISIPHRGVGS